MSNTTFVHRSSTLHSKADHLIPIAMPCCVQQAWLLLPRLTEARGKGHHVFQASKELNTQDVRRGAHTELRCVQKVPEHLKQSQITTPSVLLPCALPGTGRWCSQGWPVSVSLLCACDRQPGKQPSPSSFSSCVMRVMRIQRGMCQGHEPKQYFWRVRVFPMTSHVPEHSHSVASRVPLKTPILRL